MRTILLAAACLALASAAGRAQQRPPDCTAPAHDQFDFWVGDWVVTDSAGGRTMGTNRITEEESNCLVHEHWRGGGPGGGGGTGQSFNFYDRASGSWHQVWVSSTGSVLRLTGRLEGHSMALEGETRTPAGGVVRNRIVWTPQPDGRVRQQWLVSRDGGATWQTSFDGWYRRRG